MPGHRFQHEPEADSRPLPSAGNARRTGSPLVELALDLQRRAGNRSVTELVGTAVGSASKLTGATAATGRSAVGVQREPCIDCPDAEALPMADASDLPESGSPG